MLTLSVRQKLLDGEVPSALGKRVADGVPVARDLGIADIGVGQSRKHSQRFLVAAFGGKPSRRFRETPNVEDQNPALSAELGSGGK